MANLTKFEDLDIPALTLVAQEQYEECLWAIEKALAKQLEFGKVLLIVKAKLPHGEWGSWVRETFADHKSLRTIQRHMRGAEAIATDPSLLECADSLDGILKIVEARKPSVEVIEVADQIVTMDMPAVEVITAVATVKPVAAKPVAQKPTSPPKVSPPPPKIATAKVARLLESIVPARRARMEVILREEMKLWPQPAFEALGLILKEVVDEQLLLHGQ